MLRSFHCGKVKGWECVVPDEKKSEREGVEFAFYR